jgi:hypothetical protein
MIDFREFINDAEKDVNNHLLGNGAFARWIKQNDDENRDLGINEYGCSDAINILYMLDKLPKSYDIRKKYIETIQSLQNPETGFFNENTHDPFHTTAYCITTLKLLDAYPIYPLTNMMKLKDKNVLTDFMENQPWSEDPCLTSHRIAGLYASLETTGNVDNEWQENYFRWLWNNTDGDTGLIRQGFINYYKIPPFQYLVGSFSYMLNFEYCRLPMRFPARMIDTCIQFYDNNVNSTLGNKISFEELNWVYCINRSMRQTDYRYKDCKERLKKFEDSYSEYLLGLDFKTNDELNDLHLLFGTLCTIAELQSALPGTIKTEKPLRLVMDVRPFI